MKRYPVVAPSWSNPVPLPDGVVGTFFKTHVGRF
ncbi:hypothetical protein UFOVP238_23 [uncultured Caudovirales phage]|uniref:Uncharacterized protein n=1 Tax=uncultured Caudovirales phage TaxID=2100421 RepID=A0A6J7WU17_9CAUD|nr:hypothetical protein UFOVP238_23 [uncultured Caudovirales phage]